MPGDSCLESWIQLFLKSAWLSSYLSHKVCPLVF